MECDSKDEFGLWMERLLFVVRRLLLGIKIILDQEENLGTVDYCGKNVFKDLKDDVDKANKIIDDYNLKKLNNNYPDSDFAKKYGGE